MKIHPVAELFPMLQGPELNALAEDIKTNGLQQPIILLDEVLLDGRNRLAACKIAGVDPKFKQYGGKDPQAFVISANLHRRHLSESQRAMVAAKMANMRQGSRTDLKHPAKLPEVSQEKASQLLNVSERTVRDAKVVLGATPELIDAVESGDMPVSAAAKIAKAPAATQRDVVKKIIGGTKPTEAMRQVKAKEISEKQISKPSGKYRVIYADPPWSYGNTQPDYQTEQRDHYPVMPLKDICDLPVKRMSEDDSVLFLWVTSPILEESFSVINAWGFKYKASFVWDKVKHNMGHYCSVRHEFLLVCVRGSCQPDVRKLFDSVISEERTKHSEKPETFRKIIDTIYPNGKRIELFSRKKTTGWDTWGLEDGKND